MASIQRTLARQLTGRVPGVDKVGYNLTVDAPGREGDSVVCSIVVTGAQFDVMEDDSESVLTTTELDVSFTFQASVDRPEDKKEGIYDYMTEQLHGFSGRWQYRRGNEIVNEPYNIVSLLVLGYAQGIAGDTRVAVEAYSLRIQHHKAE